MNEYIVTAPFIQINAGSKVSLDPTQAKKRAFALDEIKKSRFGKPGTFLTTAPFHMKMGEKFGYEGELNKKDVHGIVEESIFEDLPVAEKIAGYNRPQILKFRNENCEELRLDLSKSNNVLKAQIVAHMDGLESENEEKPEKDTKPPKKKKRSHKKKAQKVEQEIKTNETADEATAPEE